jgi:hypothetical protein
VLDVGTFRSAKLPPRATSRCACAAANDAHYLIYTNVDIGLPNFYVTIDRLVDAGARR